MLVNKINKAKNLGVFSEEIIKALDLAIDNKVDNLDDLEKIISSALNIESSLSKPEIIVIIIDIISKL